MTPAPVVVPYDSIVVLGHCLELATRLAMLCKHPALVSWGSWMALVVPLLEIVLMNGTRLLTLKSKLISAM